MSPTKSNPPSPDKGWNFEYSLSKFQAGSADQKGLCQINIIIHHHPITALIFKDLLMGNRSNHIIFRPHGDSDWVDVRIYYKGTRVA